MLNSKSSLLGALFGRNANVEGQIDLDKWNRDGFYVLPGFYSDPELDAAIEAQREVWRQSHPRIVVDDMVTGERKLLASVSEHDRLNHRFKLNDLYLEVPDVRSLAINDRLTPILKKLLGHTPVLCNSLDFEKGSGQPDHVDSLYMTPQTDGHLIAIWVALEDCHPDAGPLRYYAGSNAIKPYIFSSGERHYIPEEMDKWDQYMRDNIATLGLKPTTFAAKKGDVFIWSCNLLHGGSIIKNHALTRRSIVFHYYSEFDSIALNSNLRPQSEAFWMYRKHQPIGNVEGEFPPN